MISRKSNRSTTPNKALTTGRMTAFPWIGSAHARVQRMQCLPSRRTESLRSWAPPSTISANGPFSSTALTWVSVVSAHHRPVPPQSPSRRIEDVLLSQTVGDRGIRVFGICCELPSVTSRLSATLHPLLGAARCSASDCFSHFRGLRPSAAPANESVAQCRRCGRPRRSFDSGQPSVPGGSLGGQPISSLHVPPFLVQTS
jgi:hypothetical protein